MLKFSFLRLFICGRVLVIVLSNFWIFLVVFRSLSIIVEEKKIVIKVFFVIINNGLVFL